MERSNVTVEQFFKEHAGPLQMKQLTEACDRKRIIREPTVNRPGLALSGFTRYFAYKRLQVMGHAEVFYLRELRKEEREARYAYLLDRKSTRLNSSHLGISYAVFCFQTKRDQTPAAGGRGSTRTRAGSLTRTRRT